MRKCISITAIILSLVALAGCVNETAVLSEYESYEVTSVVHSLDVQINAADFTIEQGDEFFVESNLKNLSVSEKDGVLVIADKTKRAVNYNDAMLKLYIPDDIVFEDVAIATGAGKLTAESFSADSMVLKAGAGKVQIDCLDVYNKIDINGGAGEISISDGSLNNLKLQLGVGELDMTTALRGESDLNFGVGESDLTLIGSKDDYSFEIEHGIGEITIDNKTAYNFARSTGGESFVKVNGGVGATNISFKNNSV